MRVIASSVRKGNILEQEDGQLYVVLSAESFHPGKGTPTTQIDMRRLSDGVKVSDRYKTTEQVERAFVEDMDYTYLYSDDDGHHFMNQQSFEQVPVSGDVLGDQAQGGVRQQLEGRERRAESGARHVEEGDCIADAAKGQQRRVLGLR